MESFLMVSIIIAVLVVPSVILLLKGFGKQKSYFLYSLTPMCIAIGLLGLFSFYVDANIKYDREVSNYKNYCRTYVSNFISDYKYMLDEFSKYMQDDSYIINLDSTKLSNKKYIPTAFYDYFDTTYQDKTILRKSFYSYDGSGNISFEFYIADVDYDEQYNNSYSYLHITVYNLVEDGETYQNCITNVNKLEYYLNNNKIIVTRQILSVGVDYSYSVPIVVTTCISIVINIVAICLCLIKNKGKLINFDNNKTVVENKIVNENTNINLNMSESVVESVPEVVEVKPPTWDEITEEEQLVFITKCIKQLYKKQLNDAEVVKTLSREQRALKRDSLEMNEFLKDDLNESELAEVLENAKLMYEKGINKKETGAKGEKKTKKQKLKIALITIPCVFVVVAIIIFILPNILPLELGVTLTLLFSLLLWAFALPATFITEMILLFIYLKDKRKQAMDKFIDAMNRRR